MSPFVRLDVFSQQTEKRCQSDVSIRQVLHTAQCVFLTEISSDVHSGTALVGSDWIRRLNTSVLCTVYKCTVHEFIL